MTYDEKYEASLPSAVQLERQFITSKGAYATDMSIIRLLRSGSSVAQVERFVEAEIRQHYFALKADYIATWDKVCKMRQRKRERERERERENGGEGGGGPGGSWCL